MEDNNYRAAYNNFRTQFVTIEELVNDIHNGHLIKLPNPMWDIYPWSKEKKSRYIESLIIDQPQNTLFFDGSIPIWYILVGTQEIETIFNFITNQFPLESLYFYNNQYENKYFNQLPLLIQRKILNFQFQIHILNPGSSESVRYGIYTSLINGPEHQINDYVRKIIYPESYSLLYNTCNQSRPIFGKNNRYSLENIAGHLLVYLLYKQNVFSYMYQPENYTMDILTNYILGQKDVFYKYLSQTNLSFLLQNALSRIVGNYPYNLFDMDTLIAWTTTVKTGHINTYKLQHYWDEMSNSINEYNRLGLLDQRVNYLIKHSQIIL